MVSDVKKLNPVEHVLLRTDLYLGPITPSKDLRKGYVGGVIKDVSGYSPASIRAVQEVLDNSVDAAIRSKFKSGDSIQVFLREDGFKVIDNGTGIPIKKDLESGVWQPELAFANSLAGSNFEGERATSGLFGIGVFAVNVMSTRMDLVTRFNGKQYTQSFRNNLSNIDKPEITDYEGETGTEVDVYLDLNRLQWTAKDIEVVLQLLNNIMFCYPEIDVKCYYDDGEIPLLRGEDFIKGNEIEPLCDVSGGFCRAVVTNDTSSFVGWVNGTECGGLHVKNFKSLLSGKLVDLMKIEGLERGDISRNVGGLLAIRVKNPAFHSPTKLEMVDCDKNDLKTNLEPLVDLVAEELSNNEEFVKLIESVVEERTHKKIRGKEKGSKRRVKSEKLIDATASKAEDRILIITEGDSAKGFFAQARNPKTQAVYCLKGKIKNVIGEDNILKSADSVALLDLCSVMGLSMTSPNIVNCRYNKIYITTDADHDGTSICGLLYGFYWRFWPELLMKGRVCRLLTPRYIAGSKRDFYYHENELPSPLPSDMKYIKGLGSLSLTDVKKILLKPLLERVEVDENSDKYFELVFGKGPNSADLRKEWLGDCNYMFNF